MEIQGYCTISKNATTGKGAQNYTCFIGQTLRVMEFASDGAVLVVNSEGTAAAMFDKEDVLQKFECGIIGDVICPPKLSMAEQLLYYHKVKARKGGYNPLLKQMVIQASLWKGHYNDNLLFSLENHPNYANKG